MSVYWWNTDTFQATDAIGVPLVTVDITTPATGLPREDYTRPADPVARTDVRSDTEKVAMLRQYWIPAAKTFALWAADLLGLQAVNGAIVTTPVASLSDAVLATAYNLGALSSSLDSAWLAYYKARVTAHAYVTDAQIMADNAGRQVPADVRAAVRGYPSATAFSRDEIQARVTAAIAEIQRRVSAQAQPTQTVVTTTTPTPAAVTTTTNTAITPATVVDPTAAQRAKIAQWRDDLSAARRLETDAQNIGVALADVLHAWQAAGNYPDQVRTVSGLVADAAANVDFAQQLGHALESCIQVGSNVLATGTGTFPTDPQVKAPPALPTILPARPDGSVPVVITTTVPTSAGPDGKVTGDVVKPHINWVKIGAIALSLFAIFS